VSLAVDSAVPRFYRPRTPETSLFFKVVTGHFDGFERAYPALFQARYGFWRPVIRRAVDKFLKCGDLKEGFARVRCPDCGHELFVAYSCRQRACCPSCGQKRALMLAQRLSGDSLAPVPHRQWVFTLPKRLRIYFRYDRRLLGKLCRAAYETVNGAMAFQAGDGMVVPGMVAAIQTFGDLVNWHPHIHVRIIIQSPEELPDSNPPKRIMLTMFINLYILMLTMFIEIINKRRCKNGLSFRVL